MKINLSLLPKQLYVQTLEVLPILGVKIAEEGLLVEAVQKDGSPIVVESNGKKATITYDKRNEYFRGLMLLAKSGGKSVKIEQTNSFSEFGIMLDCSRNAVKSLPHLRQMARHLALMGYNQFQLYVEDTYEVEGEPYFGYLRGRYTADEMKELDEYFASYGIEIVPCIQTLAHLNQIFRWDEYKKINDINDILLIDDERTYELIDRMFASLSKAFSSRKIHIGMDEAHAVGRGKYEDIHGAVENRSALINKHLKKVVKIAEKYGYSPMMWSDMYFRLANNGSYRAYDCAPIDESIRNTVPENVRLIYWDYYANNQSDYEKLMDRHLEFNREVGFAAGAWMWSGFAPLNALSIGNSAAAFAACKTRGIDKVMVTMWGDDGGECADFAVLPALSFAASDAYSSADREGDFNALTGIKFADFMLLDSANVIDKTAPVSKFNAQKFMLFNDCLMGIFDYVIKEGCAKVFEEHAKALRAVEKKAGAYEYLFTQQRTLCEVLAIKSELGVKTRAVYRSGDRAAIKKLVKREYLPLIAKLNEFYAAFKKVWDIENKPQGFEVHDYRVGGLIMRVRHAADRLLAYALGKESVLPELDETIIDPTCGEVEKFMTNGVNRFGKIVSASRLTW